MFTKISSGIRVDAWHFLKRKHVIPIESDYGGTVIAAKIIVYAGAPDQYYFFITKVAFNSLKNWIIYRLLYGEKISGEIWLMHNLWKTTNIKYGLNKWACSKSKTIKK